MSYVLAEDLFGNDKDLQFSAFSASYPLTLFDNLSAISFISWEEKEFFHYLSWQRAYDNLTINLSLYRYPKLSSSFAGFGGASNVSGYGTRLMLVWNH
jgi:hypothetical protein